MDQDSRTKLRTLLSRRDLLRYSILTAGTITLPGILAACAQPAAPAPTVAPAKSGAAPSAPQTAETPKKGGTLVVGMEAEINGLEPSNMTGLHTFRLMGNVFDLLVSAIGTSSQIQPGLAQSWEVANDATSLLVKLRPGVKFHDGSDFTAESVALSFDRMADEGNPYYGGGKGRALYFFPNYGKATVMDPLTVKFELKQPDAVFLSSLAYNPGSIVSAAAVKQMGKDFGNKPVGSGAFKLTSWEQNVKLTMDRFDGHWRGAPLLDRIIWKPIVEEAARFNQLLSGEVDFIVAMDPQFVPQVQAHPDLQLVQSPALHTWWVYMNLHEPHLKDKRVRQALNYAIDKESIIKNILRGTGVVSRGWAWPNTWAYEPDVTTYPYDPEKAKKLLAEAGYPNGFDIEYLVPESGSGMIAPKQIAIAMQADLKKVGVNAKITTMEWVAYMAARAGKGLDDVGGKMMGLFQMSWNCPTDDPGLYVDTVSAGQPPNEGANQSHYSNPEYIDLVTKKARSTGDQKLRAEYYKKAQKIIAEDAPWIFMFHSNQVMAARKNVKGIVLNPAPAVLDLKGAWKSS